MRAGVLIPALCIFPKVIQLQLNVFFVESESPFAHSFRGVYKWALCSICGKKFHDFLFFQKREIANLVNGL